MATNVYHGKAKAVYQEWRGTVASNTTGHTFILTFTDDNGATGAVTYVATGSDTTSSIATAVAALVSASGNPLVSQVSADWSGSIVILTARVVGVPFTVAASGTGSWTSDAVTVASSGPNDLSCGDCWTLGAPTAGQDLVFPTGCPDALYGLNFASTTFGTITTEPGSGAVGRWDGDRLHYFRGGCTGLTVRGSASCVAFDVGSSAISPQIEHSGYSGTPYRPAVNVKGSALATVYASDAQTTGQAADVGVAAAAGDTATVTAGVKVTGRGRVIVGAGVTATGTTCTADGTATLRSSATLPAVKLGDGCRGEALTPWTATTLGRDAVLALLCGGTFGTVTSFCGIIDKSGNAAPITISTCVANGNTPLIDPSGSVTITTETRNNGRVLARLTSEGTTA